MGHLRFVSISSLVTFVVTLFTTSILGQEIFRSEWRNIIPCNQIEPLIEKVDVSTQLDVLRGTFTPHVILYNRTEPVLFEAVIEGNPTRVNFEIDGAELSMKDDGTDGDINAGDNIYRCARVGVA